MVPIAFAYGGWQTSTFVAGEMRNARRDLSRGLLMGVAGVVILYLAVNFVCLQCSVQPVSMQRRPRPPT